MIKSVTKMDNLAFLVYEDENINGKTRLEVVRNTANLVDICKCKNILSLLQKQSDCCLDCVRYFRDNAKKSLRKNYYKTNEVNFSISLDLIEIASEIVRDRICELEFSDALETTLYSEEFNLTSCKKKYSLITYVIRNYNYGKICTDKALDLLTYICLSDVDVVDSSKMLLMR